jgi:hypothetical protein
LILGSCHRDVPKACFFSGSVGAIGGHLTFGIYI